LTITSNLANLSGNINLSGQLSAQSSNGIGGSIDLDATNFISALDISINAKLGGGSINLFSDFSTITVRDITANSISGNGGTVTLTSASDLNINSISGTSVSARGANVFLTSDESSVTLVGYTANGNQSALDLSATTGTGGTAAITAFSNISVASAGGANIDISGAAGGSASLASANGSVTLMDGSSNRGNLLGTAHDAGNTAGSFTLSSRTGIILGNVDINGTDSANGGTLTIPASGFAGGQSGDISIVNIFASGYSNVATSGDIAGISNAGTVTVSTTGNVSIGTILADAVGLGVGSGSRGASVNLSASGDISLLSNLSLRGLNGANGGSISANSTGGNISFGSSLNLSADSSASQGFGGFANVIAQNGSINLAGPVSADGVGSYSYAGILQFSAATTISASGAISARGLQGTPASAGFAHGGRIGFLTTGSSGGIAFNPLATLNVSSGGNSAGGVTLSSAGSAGIVLGTDIIASASGANHTAGSVFITSSNGAASIAAIDARGLSSASGGSVFVSSTGNLSAGSASGVQGINTSGASAGAITLHSNLAILTNPGASLNLNSSASVGTAGNINITSAGNNGSTSINIGNINASGVTDAGEVLIVSLDTASNPVNIGSITTTASGIAGTAGSLSVATLGQLNISGLIDARNIAAIATSPARSGSVFLSSGYGALAADLSISHSGISFTNSNGSANGQAVLIASHLISGPSVDPAAGIFPNYVAAFSTINLPASTTFAITVTPGSTPVNYNPQGFDTIAWTTNCCTFGSLQMNTGSNPYLIVPILSKSSATFNFGSTANTTSADSFTVIARDGLTVIGSINTSGSLAGGNVTLASLTGNISFTSGLGDALIYTAGTGASATGGSVSLLTPAGSVSLGNSSASSAFSNINTSGTAAGGSVSAVARSGLSFNRAIKTTSNDSAGSVSLLTASGNINFFATGSQAPWRFIDATSTIGSGGNIAITIGQSILNLSGNGDAGLIATVGCCDERSINSSSTSGNAGDISLNIISGSAGRFGSSGTINFIQFIANSATGDAGSISANIGGAINADWTFSASGSNGGDISIYAGSSVSLGGNLSSAASQNSAGAISITSHSGSISLPAIQANGGLYGGDIQLQAPNSTITLSGNGINFSNLSTFASIQAGNVDLRAGSNITFSRAIDTHSTREAGNVELTVTAGNIYFNGTGVQSPWRFIDATSSSGSGGDISVTIGQSSCPCPATAPPVSSAHLAAVMNVPSTPLPSLATRATYPFRYWMDQPVSSVRTAPTTSYSSLPARRPAMPAM
jgi:hypothetical protein